MPVRATKVPQTPFNENSIDWATFLKNLEKNPGSAVSDLDGSSTDTDRNNAINAILAILRDNKLMDK